MLLRYSQNDHKPLIFISLTVTKNSLTLVGAFDNECKVKEQQIDEVAGLRNFRT